MLLENFFDSHLAQVLIVVLAVMVAQAVGLKFIERLVRKVVKGNRYETKLDERKREDTIISMFHTLYVVLLWIVGIFIILTIFKVNIAALVTGAGVLGVVFGLGAQSTIKDYLSGIYILAENQYRVGDVVTLSGGPAGAVGVSGVVEDVTLRITQIRSLDGTLNTIRNGEAVVIANRTFKFSSVLIDLTLDYDNDINMVEKVINDTGQAMLKEEQWNELITEPITFLRVDDFSDRGMVVRIIGKVRPAAQWEISGDFRRRIKEAFDRHGITLATQQLIIHQPDLENHHASPKSTKSST